MIDRIKSVFTVSLSVPKIIGTGPITTTPPPFTLPFRFEFLAKSHTTAIRVSAKPTKMRVKPMLQSGWSLMYATVQAFLCK